MINVLYIQMTLTRNHVWAVVPINKYKQNSKNKHIYMSTWSTSWENANWSLSDCVLCMYKQRYSANLCKLCVLYHCKYHTNVSIFFHCIVLWNCTVCHINFEKKYFFPLAFHHCHVSCTHITVPNVLYSKDVNVDCLFWSLLNKMVLKLQSLFHL